MKDEWQERSEKMYEYKKQMLEYQNKMITDNRNKIEIIKKEANNVVA